MHVLQMIDLLRIGGAQKLVETFALHAEAYGMQVTVLSLHTDPRSPLRQALLSAGVEVLAFPAPRLLDAARLRALSAHLRERRYDVVQTHLTYANILGGLTGAWTGTPVVATLHSVGQDPRFRHPVRRALETWALRYAARSVVAVGGEVARAHAPRLGRRRKPVIIPNAVPEIVPLSAGERASLRARLGCSEGHLALLAVGRLAAPKGYPDLLKAFALLLPQYPGLRLWVAGDGVLRGELRSLAASLGLDGHVFFLGRRDDVPALLSAADIFVNASHWEGLPLAVLEAMMAGLPVVATAVGDIPSVLPAEAGSLVPPRQPEALADALRPLLEDAALRARRGRAAREHALRTCSVEAWMLRLRALYEETASGRGRRSA